MRGIEGALHVLGQVGKGRFASEALREAGRGMAPPDMTLASSLAYAVLRRRELWQTVYGGFMRQKDSREKEKLPPLVRDCLLTGTAGLLELRHFAGGVLVNGLLDCMKRESMTRWVPLVNAVLHSVGERGAGRVEELRRSPSLEDRALCAGVPVWSLPAWTRTWQRAELNGLFDLLPQPPRSSLRPAPGKREEILERLAGEEIEADPSDLSGAIHLGSTILPREVPGFDEGLCTVQSEGAILAADLAARHYKGGVILDMCSGRGVKAGQLLQSLPDARLEGWELSGGRHKSALGEMNRLGVSDRARLRCGSALEMEPWEPPSLVLLDAPCSGSGTWTRKPESKWRLDWKQFDKLAVTQRRLLERALTLCSPGGVILYVTCSLLRQENENVVAEVLSGHPECAEFPVAWGNSRPFRRGRPWGTYIWPETPWLDGFYCAVILKKG